MTYIGPELLVSACVEGCGAEFGGCDGGMYLRRLGGDNLLIDLKSGKGLGSSGLSNCALFMRSTINPGSMSSCR